MAAAVMLLAAVVLLHFTTPHHTAAQAYTPTAAAATTETRSEAPSSASYGVTSPALQAGTGTGSVHAGTAADSPALPPRADHLVEVPPLAADTSAVKAADGLDDARPRTARPRPARDLRSPGHLAVLQTFRC
ncbi:hypothetical protein [Streptomyces sp. NPDC048277]|uniref:hypothetical protein n=1 Tax=Streptomyces sp. NPDC048277 TaxID=3155027 RepID=UPI0034028706